MNKFVLLLLLAGLTGCASSRVSRYDEFEKVKVDKMVGNGVNLHVLSRTVICLNAMRESRWPAPVTNTTVAYVTNLVSSSVTNLTVTSSENRQLSGNTNTTIPAPMPLPAAVGGESNAPVVIASPPADNTAGGVTISTTRNESTATTPSQTVVSTSIQTVTLLNSQATVNTNNQAITGGTNDVITVETNLVVTTVVNPVITAVTNVTVKSPDQAQFDYYLYTEIASADFALSPGESLVVLVDGLRYGLTPSQPQSGWTSRKGYLTTFYRVSPEAISGIANAREVKIRIKGASGALERELSGSSQQRFRTFLVKHFAEETPESEKETKSKHS